jgi:UDP-glucuronate decarboxylase
MKRILVTGGAGFIGSHLVDKLLARGDDVVVVDNLFTGRKQNFLHHRDNPRFEFIRHDVVEPILLDVEEVYHLACPASPIHYQNNPIKTVKTNVSGTLNMLGLARRVRARFLLASTSEVYGDPLVHPQVETYFGNVNTVGPRSCYDEGKRVAETLAHCYREQNGVDARIVRIFNTYGPRMIFDDGRVVSNFIVQALRGDPLSVYGDGSQTRSFCYVDDLVDGLVAAMDAPSFTGPANLGNPNEFTIAELAEMVLRMTSSKSVIEKRPLPQDDPIKRRPDITIAARELGFDPKVGLEEGLRRTIAEFRTRLQRS